MTPSPLADLASPALLFKRSAIEHNLDLMLELAGSAERLRPHVKTHKCPNIIALHVAKGITKFKCATIAEAEMVARNGASSVLLAKQPVGPDIRRLVELCQAYQTVEVLTIVDSEKILSELDKQFSTAGRSIGVLVDVDCGMHRTGIAPTEALVSLYQQLSTATSIVPMGFHVYDGHLHDPDLQTRQSRCAEALRPVMALRDQLLASGHSIPLVIAGGSPTFAIHAKNPNVSECSPGTTVLWDTGYLDAYPDLPFQPAAFLLTRVISRLSDTAVCVDLGHKALAADKPQPRARFSELPEASLQMHSEEHLVIVDPACNRLEVGAPLVGIPVHVCPTVALHDYASVLSDNNEVIDRWPIEARVRSLTV